PVPTGANSVPSSPHTISELTLLAPTDASDTNLTDLGFYSVAADDEKFVTESVAFSGFVVSLGYNPDLNGSISLCEAGGSSNLHRIGLTEGSGFFTGSGTGDPTRSLRIGSGMPTSPRISQFGQTANIVVQTPTGRLRAPNGPAPNTKTI